MWSVCNTGPCVSSLKLYYNIYLMYTKPTITVITIDKSALIHNLSTASKHLESIQQFCGIFFLFFFLVCE